MKMVSTVSCLLCTLTLFFFVQIEMNGLTGKIKFDQRGQRSDFEHLAILAYSDIQFQDSSKVNYSTIKVCSDGRKGRLYLF